MPSSSLADMWNLGLSPGRMGPEPPSGSLDGHGHSHRGTELPATQTLWTRYTPPNTHTHIPTHPHTLSLSLSLSSTPSFFLSIFLFGLSHCLVFVLSLCLPLSTPLFLCSVSVLLPACLLFSVPLHQSVYLYLRQLSISVSFSFPLHHSYPLRFFTFSFYSSLPLSLSRSRSLSLSLCACRYAVCGCVNEIATLL